MGDMADEILNCMMDGDEEYMEQEDDAFYPRSITCKYCGKADLHWSKTPAGWRTADKNGLHDCHKFREGVE